MATGAKAATMLKQQAVEAKQMAGRHGRARRKEQARATAEAVLGRLGLKAAVSAPLTRSEAAAFIELLTGQRVSHKLLQRWLRAGKIPGAYRWGAEGTAHWRIPPESLVAWLQARQTPPTPTAQPEAALRPMRSKQQRD
jgi:hypothetical protein